MYGKMPCFRNGTRNRNYSKKGILSNGKMRKLRQDHHLWTQSFLLTTRHQSQVQTKPAKDIGDGEGSRRA